MNRLIVHLWIAQWLLCAFCALYKYLVVCDIYSKSTIWTENKEDTTPYLYLGEPEVGVNMSIKNFLVQLGSWFILLVNFVPISMMLTIEMVRFFQAFFIENDKLMAANGGKPSVQSSNLNDDLG
jgi:phospholipid-transporting ATPase